MSVRVEQALGRVARWVHGHPARALACAAALVVVGGWQARQIAMRANLIELLPEHFESVQGLERLKERFGGIGYVVVVGLGAEPEKLRQFADDMAPKIEALESIRYVEHRREFDFFRDRALYYLSLDDLKEVHRRIAAREAYERRQRNPLYIALDEEEEPSLDFSDIEERYGTRTDQRMAGSGEAYYLDAAERMVVLLAKPAEMSGDLGFAARVVGSVERLIQEQDLTPYGPDFRVEYTGTFKKKLDQQAQIARDLTTASAVALALLIAYMLFHFRSVLAVLLILAPVATGLVWVYGLVHLLYGSINLLTGFLGAILGGLGFEHGIHLIGRYAGLRVAGRSGADATEEAFAHTGLSAVLSSVVAALTFGSVAISEFRAFREFGVIAALGMLVVIAAYFLVLPALLGLAARTGWGVPAPQVVAGSGSELARWLPRRYLRTAAASIVITLAFAVNFPNARFNYDFAALEDSSLPSFVLDAKVNRILGYSQTPAVILTDNKAAEAEVVRVLKERKAKLGERSTIDFVASLSDLVPGEQQEKQVVMQEIGVILDKVSPRRLEPATRERFDELRAMVRTPPFTREDVPKSVRQQYEGIGTTEMGFVLIFPSISLTDGARVMDFAAEVRDINLAGGGALSAAGEPMILADVIAMVRREAAPVMVSAVVLVLAAMWLVLGSLRTALVCFLPTLLSILSLAGLMPVVGVRYNYLNIVVIPILIGVTVDAGIHLVTRLREHGGEFEAVYGETGRAIVGGLFTSAVGFGALLLADHPGLNSIGTLANLGFAVNLLLMLIGFPATLLWLQSRAAAPK